MADGAARRWWAIDPEDPRVRVGVALTPVLVLAVALGMKLTVPAIYRFRLRDGNEVETLQALCFLGAAASAAAVARRLWAHSRLEGLAWSLLAAGLLFVVGEEISWGQQIFGWSTPEAWKAANHQNELTLHNLEGIQASLKGVLWTVCLYGAFARLLVPGSWRREHGDVVDRYVPRWPLPLWFLPGVLLYAIFLFQYTLAIRWGQMWLYVGNDQTKHFLMFKDQEVVELLIAGAFLWFTWENLARLRRSS